MKSLSQHINEAFNVNESSTIKVIVTEPAKKKFLKDLSSNNIKYSNVESNTYSIDNTPKAKMAIKMAKERNGQSSVKIVNENIVNEDVTKLVKQIKWLTDEDITGFVLDLLVDVSTGDLWLSGDKADEKIERSIADAIQSGKKVECAKITLKSTSDSWIITMAYDPSTKSFYAQGLGDKDSSRNPQQFSSHFSKMSKDDAVKQVIGDFTDNNYTVINDPIL